MTVVIHPFTPARVEDFQKLFGKNGACAGCWCMWWRLPRKQWVAQKGEGNRRAIRKLVQSESAPGLIAYVDDEPAGWCAVAPRDAFVRLASSRVLKPVVD